MSIDAVLDQAFQEYNAGRLERAEEMARHALTITPTHGDAIYLLSLIAIRARAFDAAEDMLYGVVKMYPRVKMYDLALALVLQQTGRLAEALSIYEKYPDDAAALVERGNIYLAKNQIAYALECFDQALTLDTGCGAAMVGKAGAFKMMGKPYATLLEKALECGANVDAYYQLSMHQYDKGKYQKALEYVRAALAINTSDYLYNQEGLCQEQLNDLEGAWQAYNRAISSNPYYATAYLNQGNVLAQMKKTAEAEAAYKQAILHDGRNVQALVRLGLLLHHQGRVGEALEKYQAAVVLDPKNVDVLYGLAGIVDEMGDVMEAIGLYFNILALDPKKVGVAKRLETCILKLAKKDKKQARAFANGWVKNFPNNKTAQGLLGKI